MFSFINILNKVFQHKRYNEISDKLFATSIIDSLKRETEGKKLIDKIETYCKKYPSVKEFKDFKLSLQPKQKTKQQKQFHQL